MYRAGVGATGSNDELSPLRPLSATLKRVPARRCVRPAPSSAFPQSKAVTTCWPKPTVCPLELVAQPYSSPNIPRPHIVRREHRAFSNDEEEPCTSKSRPLHLATKAYAFIRKGAAALSLIYRSHGRRSEEPPPSSAPRWQPEEQARSVRRTQVTWTRSERWSANAQFNAVSTPISLGVVCAPKRCLSAFSGPPMRPGGTTPTGWAYTPCPSASRRPKSCRDTPYRRE